MKPWLTHLIQGVIALAVLSVGVGGARLLISMKTDPQKKEIEEVARLVETIEARRRSVTVTVAGYGTVAAQTRASLSPQVAGRVIDVADALRAGGAFDANQQLVVIDPTDYRLSVEQAEATLAESEASIAGAEATLADAAATLADAEIEFERIEGLRRIQSANQREYEQVKVKLDGAKARHRSAEAQLRRSQASRQAAAIALAIAETQLARTKLSMPFAGRVVTEQVDVGQYVTPGQVLADVYGRDVMEVMVPLEDRELAWFDLPQGGEGDADVAAGGATATLTANFAGKPRTWTGRVARLAAEIDATSRMVEVIIETAEPRDESGVMLTPGMFVNVAIEGRPIDDVYQLPRAALRDQDTVYLANDNRLRIVNVDVLRSTREQAIVRGLNDGDAVITSPLDIVAEGMLVRRRDVIATDVPPASEPIDE